MPTLEEKHEADDADVMAQVTITVYRSGAMAVSGDIHDQNFALSLIDAARESVKSHHLRKHGELIITAGRAR
ncbi:hypothetical protein, partial [Streptococcus pneumoniae]